MKKLNYLLLLIATIVSISGLKAQQNELPISIKFGGYVHSLFTYDTHQTVAAREGHILLYPQKEKLDAAGKDINKDGVYNMAVIQSRINAKISGPEILGAKTSGLLEAEFIGNGETDTNGLRLRHAFVNLDWGNTSLLIGQTWSPLFVAEVFPATVGANAGLPFKPFARNPQLRLTHKAGNWKFLAALASERDYPSTGPQGASNKYLRNAGIPILQGQVHYYAGKHLIGFSGEYKNIKPSLMSTTGSKETGDYREWKNDETISSWAMMGYFKLNFKPITFKAQATYGTNMTDLLMLGGYAVKYLNPATNEASYTGIKVLGSWAELSYEKKDWQWAVLAGYSKNYGAEDKIINRSDLIYARGKDIGELYRLAPRVCKKVKNLKFEFEAEYTAAAYGSITDEAKVVDTKWVGNTRYSLGVYYFF
ncbi:DcaP family trimeric outer membrane transporter [Marinifilum sp.]|uniref:DcaP family trimeric outer membrane transporter n=1 Tax=Marinifilum sp. TaxID=2033137 RepID=UPI003BA99340